MPANGKRHDKVAPVFDPRLRYSVDTAAQFLNQSRAKLYIDIREGRLAVIREGRRTFVPGTEIARRCSISAA
jgi:hypothetical protein